MISNVSNPKVKSNPMSGTRKIPSVSRRTRLRIASKTKTSPDRIIVKPKRTASRIRIILIVVFRLSSESFADFHSFV
ncbi:MAG: hypothetical protein SFU25_05895 [Candidatus Caenarcaniphilales bacterium]|nr:hypothetical protein [Candidatus Caenarcaniphilales bacterium]